MHSTYALNLFVPYFAQKQSLKTLAFSATDTSYSTALEVCGQDPCYYSRLSMTTSVFTCLETLDDVSDPFTCFDWYLRQNWFPLPLGNLQLSSCCRINARQPWLSCINAQLFILNVSHLLICRMLMICYSFKYCVGASSWCIGVHGRCSSKSYESQVGGFPMFILYKLTFPECAAVLRKLTQWCENGDFLLPGKCLYRGIYKGGSIYYISLLERSLCDRKAETVRL